jgi:hypothetical protein
LTVNQIWCNAQQIPHYNALRGYSGPDTAPPHNPSPLHSRCCDVRFWPLADMPLTPSYVRFWG